MKFRFCRGILDISGQTLLNTKNGYAFLLNGFDKLFFSDDVQIMNITVFYLKRKNKYPKVNLKIKKHSKF